MSKIRKRYLVAAATAITAGTTLFSAPAGAFHLPSFQQIQTPAKDGVITSNCFFQVTYVSLTNGTITGKMNGQAQSTNFLSGLGVKGTEISCELINDAGQHVDLSHYNTGQSSQTGVHVVTLPLSEHYTLCTYAYQNMYNGGFDDVDNCVTSG